MYHTKLSSDEIEHYHEYGYVVPSFTLAPEVLNRMREAFVQMQEQNPHLSSNNMLCPHLEHAGVQNLKGDKVWLEFASLPEICDMVAQLIGPDFLLWGTTLFGKPARTGKEVPMHQDGEYWPIRPLATCSAWIALDDTDEENGCLEVISGSHKNKQLLKHKQDDGDHLVLNQVLLDHEYNEEDRKPIRLKAGQVSFHDVYLAHGSKPNHSDRRRAGFVCRYMPMTSHFDHELGKSFQKKTGVVDFATRRVIKMRGEDICGKNNFLIGT